MKVVFLQNDSINTLTGGYIYNKYIVDGLLLKNYKVSVISLKGNFPHPTQEDLEKCDKILSNLTGDEFLIIDSLILGAIPDLIPKIKKTIITVGLIHLPISIDITGVKKPELSYAEKQAMELTNKLVVTSHFTKNILLQSGLTIEKISVIEPGIEDYPVKNSYPEKPYNLLCIANYTRSKNHDLLIKSLNQLKEYSWEMNFYGNTTDIEYFTEIKSLIKKFGLSNRIFLNGPLEREKISEVYLNSDLFILPSKFETYGMVLTEALAHGIPVITTSSGGIPYTVPSSMGLFAREGTVENFKLLIEKTLTENLTYKYLTATASSFYKQAQKWEKSVDSFEKILLTRR